MLTKRSDAQLLVEQEKQFECRLVEISRSKKGKETLHVLYIIINIIIVFFFFFRKRIKNPGMSCNLLRVPIFMVQIGGQIIFYFCQIYFLREEGVPEADINV